jgi:hypothetical protein
MLVAANLISSPTLERTMSPAGQTKSALENNAAIREQFD